MICGSKQGIEAADGLDWTLLLIQSIGQLQLGRSIVRRELQQLAVKPFGFCPGLGFFEVSCRAKHDLKLVLRGAAGLA